MVFYFYKNLIKNYYGGEKDTIKIVDLFLEWGDLYLDFIKKQYKY